MAWIRKSYGINNFRTTAANSSATMSTVKAVRDQWWTHLPARISTQPEPARWSPPLIVSRARRALTAACAVSTSAGLEVSAQAVPWVPSAPVSVWVHHQPSIVQCYGPVRSCAICCSPACGGRKCIPIGPPVCPIYNKNFDCKDKRVGI